MKICNINEENIGRFFEVIDSCEGRVELVSNDFRLNLKSNLVKYVALVNIFSNKEIKEIELLAYNQNDVNKLLEFMISG